MRFIFLSLLAQGDLGWTLKLMFGADSVPFYDPRTTMMMMVGSRAQEGGKLLSFCSMVISYQGSIPGKRGDITYDEK